MGILATALLSRERRPTNDFAEITEDEANEIVARIRAEAAQAD